MNDHGGQMPCEHATEDSALVFDNYGSKGSEPGIHALVVGVSAYDPLLSPSGVNRGVFQSIPGAAAGAAGFANWLIKDFHHPGKLPVRTVRVLLSPTEPEEESILPLRSWAQVSEGILKSELKAWRDDCNRNSENVAVLYASGHGAAITASAAHVFLPEVNTSGDRYGSSLNLAVVQEAMAGCAAASNIYVIDTCASREKQLHVPPGKGIGLDIDPELGEPRERVLVISSARFGMKAWTLGDSRNTVFSAALLSLLQRSGEWLRNTGTFAVTAERLKEDFPGEMGRLLGPQKAARQKLRFSGQHEARGLHCPDPLPKFSVSFMLSPTARGSFAVEVHQFGSGDVVFSAPVTSEMPADGKITAGFYYAIVVATEGQYAGKSTPPQQLPVDRDATVHLPSPGE